MPFKNTNECYLLLIFIKILLYTQILQKCDNKQEGHKTYWDGEGGFHVWVHMYVCVWVSVWSAFHWKLGTWYEISCKRCVLMCVIQRGIWAWHHVHQVVYWSVKKKYIIELTASSACCILHPLGPVWHTQICAASPACSLTHGLGSHQWQVRHIQSLAYSCQASSWANSKLLSGCCHIICRSNHS